MQSKWTTFQYSAHMELYTAANRRVSASVPLTVIAEAIQEIKMLCSTDARTREQRKADSGTNRYYEIPGYEATFLATLEQKAEITVFLL